LGLLSIEELKVAKKMALNTVKSEAHEIITMLYQANMNDTQYIKGLNKYLKYKLEEIQILETSLEMLEVRLSISRETLMKGD
jgi:hypothetical protein